MTDANEPGPIERFSAAAVADDRPMIFSRWLLDFSRTIDAEIAALHAKIAALKARLPEPEPARETGWAVVDRDGDPFATCGFVRRDGPLTPLIVWFPIKQQAQILASSARDAGKETSRAALLYKDTLEEVDA